MFLPINLTHILISNHVWLLILTQLEADYHREYMKVLDVLESVNDEKQVETAIKYAHLFFKKYPEVNPMTTLIYTYLTNFKTKFNLK